MFSRNHDDYDLVLYVANWPEGRRQAWDLLLRARAIENQCYVVGVNRVGRAQVNYNGGSAIVDFQGTLLAACVDGQESSATAQLNMPRLMAFRKQFPVLHDADAFRLCEL